MGPNRHAVEPVRDSAVEGINSRSQRWVRPEDLNAHGTLFGGSLLRWIDEESTIFATIQLGSERVVTKSISEIDFGSSARQGDIIEMGLRAAASGRTSLAIGAYVRNIITRRSILTVDRIVFVSVGEDGFPAPYGYSTIMYERDRIPPRESDPPHHAAVRRATRPSQAHAHQLDIAKFVFDTRGHCESICVHHCYT